MPGASLQKMSTSVTKVNGLVVVTQIFPEGEGSKDSIAMTPAFPKVHVAPAAEPEYKVPVLAMTRQFLRGQPKPLGTVQICIGFVTMAIGLIGFLTSFNGLTAFVTGGVYGISGIVTVASSKGISAGLIKGTLAMNLLSVVTAVAGVVFFCMALTVHPEIITCPRVEIPGYYSNFWECEVLSFRYMSVLYGIKGLLLSMAVLEASIALTVCVFSFKAICQSSSSQLVRIATRGLEESASVSGSDEALLGSDGDLASPAPYVA
ncbi:membrane-spanning 4-domains subfamily A member 4A-like [Arapaima gigas]